MSCSILLDRTHQKWSVVSHNLLYEAHSYASITYMTPGFWLLSKGREIWQIFNLTMLLLSNCWGNITCNLMRTNLSRSTLTQRIHLNNTLKNSPLKWTTNGIRLAKGLGVTVEDNLSWSIHVSKKVEMALRACSLIFRNSQSRDPETVILLFSYFHPSAHWILFSPMIFLHEPEH